jgi:hypothetical protein
MRGGGGGGVPGSQPGVHMEPQINIGDLTLYLSYANDSPIPRTMEIFSRRRVQGSERSLETGTVSLMCPTTPDLTCKYVINSVSDPNYFNADPDPDSGFIFTFLLSVFFHILSFFGGEEN